MYNIAKNIGVNLGLTGILVAMVLPICHVDFAVTRVVYSAAAGIYLLARLVLAGTYSHLPIRARRLHRLELWSGVFFAAGAVLMFIRSVGYNDAIAFTLAGGAIVIYTSLALPKAEKD